MFDDYLYSTDDHDRAILATEGLLLVLAKDERLRATYLEWGRSVQKVYEAHRPLQPDVSTEQLLAHVLQWGVMTDRIYWAGVVTEIGLPYGWLAHMLLTVFQARLLEDASKATFDLRFWKPTLTLPPRLPGETSRAFARRVAAADAPPPGRRRVQNTGVHIARDVEWFYRVKIKRPADSTRSIAKEYVSNNKHLSETSDAGRTVRDGIARAEGILNSIVLTQGRVGIALTPGPTTPLGE